jgi:hypothetical protein
MHRPQDKQEKAILTVLEQAEPLCGDIAARESGLFFVESLSRKIRMMNRRVCCWRGYGGNRGNRINHSRLPDER